MEIMAYRIVVLCLFLMLIVHFVRCDSKCADEYAAKAEKSRNSCEQSHPDSSEYCTRGYQTFINSIPRLCQNNNRKKRSDDENNCIYSATFQNYICVTSDYIYQLGLAVSAPCNTNNQGQQKCAGLITTIMCVFNQWTIQQICPSGTTCLTVVGLVQNILCGLLNPSLGR
ncbi:hypothetical protein I4U23_031325 [Adineta vaga]|nr:hypothetical protein I4U23_031325 [Adineta vaga]